MLALLGATGCGARRAGSVGAGPATGAPTATVSTTRIREDFDNALLIDQTNNVVIDFNRGLVTLPVQTFPDAPGGTHMTLSTSLAYNGTITADDLELRAGASVEASDSIALLAPHTLVIDGAIRAGRGGVILVAGTTLQIRGTVESEGPIQIFLGDAAGTLDISGTVSAVSTLPGQTSPITVRARGTVRVSGRVEAGADEGLPGGDVQISAYGDVTVTGTSAHVAASARDDGLSGDVSIQTQGQVALSGGAWIGGQDLTPPPAGPGVFARGLAAAGDVDIEAAALLLGRGSRIVPASSAQGRGGTARVIARDRLQLDEDARVLGGDGLTSGALDVHAGSVVLGTRAVLSGGDGFSAVGRVDVESAGPMSLAAGARIEGGAGACTSGGDVRVGVAGPLTLAATASIAGGSWRPTALVCPPSRAPSPGGNVEVSADSATGLTGAVAGGAGTPPGAERTTIDPAFTVPRPSLDTSNTGSVLSKIIDRGSAAVGQAPVLVEAKFAAPEGTRVVLELGGAVTSSAAFTYRPLLGPDPGAAVAELAGARFFRYRLTLVGRAFDTPVVDYFDVDLAPRNAD